MNPGRKSGTATRSITLSYPAYIHTEELNRYGFAINPDNPRQAVHTIYPTLSCRWQCDKCGVWSSSIGGLRGMFCLRCVTDRKPHTVTNQTYKLYHCCNDRECVVRQQAEQFLGGYGIELLWGSHDGYGGYYDLKPVKELDEEEQEHFFLQLNAISVSKFRARKMVHPGTKARSKLPKS